jgi:hypothetical protein
MTIWKIAIGGFVVFALGIQAVSAQDVLVDPAGQNIGSLVGALKFGGQEPALQTKIPTCLVGKVCMGPTLEGISSNRVSTGLNPLGLDFYTRGAPRLSITSEGLIGIGTPTPSRTLELHHRGDVEIGLQSSDGPGRLWTVQSSGGEVPSLAGTFQIIDRTLGKSRLTIDDKGMVSVGVLQITGGADVAEPFAMERAIPQGAVVSIDSAHAGRLRLSDRPYDRRVAGIVSGANGIAPGLSLNQSDLGDGRNVALSGRVYVLADATQRPIEPGDLLTTSSLPGRAMKAANIPRAQGAIIGKAMSALTHGEGVVLVLVSLQ